jgi:hypothetical protein
MFRGIVLTAGEAQTLDAGDPALRRYVTPGDWTRCLRIVWPICPFGQPVTHDPPDSRVLSALGRLHANLLLGRTGREELIYGFRSRSKNRPQLAPVDHLGRPGA